MRFAFISWMLSWLQQFTYIVQAIAAPLPCALYVDLEWPVVQNDFWLTFAGLLCYKLEVFFPRSRLKVVFEEAEGRLLAKCAGFVHTYLPKSSQNFTSRSCRSLLRTSGASFLSKRSAFFSTICHFNDMYTTSEFHLHIRICIKGEKVYLNM